MNNILNSKQIFSILMFVLVLIMVTERISPSYAVPINYSQLNNRYPYDNMKQHGDDNAFSDLSRGMTSSAPSDNLTSLPPNSRGPNFMMGDINNTWPNNIGRYGIGGNDISSGPIFTQHGFSNSLHIWYHRFR